MELFFIVGLGITIIVILTGFRSETKKRFIVVNKRIVKLQNEFETYAGIEPDDRPKSTPVTPIQSPVKEVIDPKPSSNNEDTKKSTKSARIP